jgi:type I restriction enzyme S subunit
MSEWRQVSLTELGTVERGKSRHRPRNDPSLYGGDVPFFQTGDVKAATLYMTNASQWYSAKGVAQSRTWEPGTVCITIAANISETAILGRRGCFPDSVLGFTPTYQSADAYFVKYLLDVHRGELASAARGTTQDNLSLEKLLTYRFRIPDALTRARIAATLRAFDDLIENNRRRIEVLEEMARAVYREWFVHFRYPGHESAALVDSPLGALPEGWGWGQVDTHFVLQRGFDLPTSEREPGSVPVIGASGVQGFHSTAKAQGPGLTTGRSGTVGVVTYVPDDFWPLNTSLWVKEFRLSTPRYAYFLLSSIDLLQSASGAAVPTLNRNVVHALPATCPPRSLIELWDAAAAPVFDLMDVLRRQDRRLEGLRELLLPRLVNGQIDVSSLDLDALVEDSVP